MANRLIFPVQLRIPQVLQDLFEEDEEEEEEERISQNRTEIVFEPNLFNTSLNVNSTNGKPFEYTLTKPSLRNVKWTEDEAETRFSSIEDFKKSLASAGDLFYYYILKYKEFLGDDSVDMNREASKNYHLLAHHCKELIQSKGRGLVKFECQREDTSDCYDDFHSEPSRDASSGVDGSQCSSRAILDSLHNLVKDRLSADSILGPDNSMTLEETAELHRLISEQDSRSLFSTA
ncbi:uncharacterized protein I206_106737 [Kwoniella pini CBS 10737]|uniref:Uncharacterized protein n=1 Tax=Kwoniella pini CBS 10737 TaxID=1296096 RepID=A0A1B9HTC2_9TREE|nr:uncharacterized protein I206_07375 [Kwoniella pini CBS 10737]OCF46522.1 hypothetical protein I206_07375 [Kwoniella pini CBS 10737]